MPTSRRGCAPTWRSSAPMSRWSSASRRTAELTRVNEELAQAQMLAEEANLGKTRFLAAVGHDILQPLNAARLYCASLIEKAARADPARPRRTSNPRWNRSRRSSARCSTFRGSTPAR
jgi:signal transduction histidine kinase